MSSTPSVWTQPMFQGPRPRHVLGLWVNYRKLGSRGSVPSKRDRIKLIGKMPFDAVFGGAQDDFSLGANQTIELRYTVQSDFIVYAWRVSSSQGSASSPGCRIGVQDISTMPGKGKTLSNTLVNNVNWGGTASKPRYLRKLYTFKSGRTIVVKITNLSSSTNKVQVVLSGVFDE